MEAKTICFPSGVNSGAVFSGAAYTVLHLSSLVPTLGASGAISAVIGAYLVLFPQTQITVLYWIVFLMARS